jgi:hypothetical protein
MLIDTDKLKEALYHVYAIEAEQIDNNTRSDSLAIKRLTISETKQIKDTEIIDSFIYLAQHISEQVKNNPDFKNIIL